MNISKNINSDIFPSSRQEKAGVDCSDGFNSKDVLRWYLLPIGLKNTHVYKMLKTVLSLLRKQDLENGLK